MRFMLLITALIFLVLLVVVPIWLALLLAIGFFFLWFRLNIYGSSRGLVKSNLNVYFSARSKGQDHEEALARVVTTRYPFSPDRQNSVISDFRAVSDSPLPETQVKTLIFTIFCEENGPPPREWMAKIYSIIEQEYRRCQERFQIDP